MLDPMTGAHVLQAKLGSVTLEFCEIGNAVALATVTNVVNRHVVYALRNFTHFMFSLFLTWTHHAPISSLLVVRIALHTRAPSHA